MDIRQGMKQVWAAWRVGLALGAAALFLFPLPTLYLTARSQSDTTQEVLPPAPTPIASTQAESTEAPTGWDQATTLNVLLGDGSVETMTMGDYLWRVVAAEMPASFEPQALCAQAVCARTYTLWKMNAHLHQEEGADICADSTCCQAYIDPSSAATNWGDNAAAYQEKITAAVTQTNGQVLTYDGSPIQALFFSSSTGSTEDAAEVWGNSLPYLVSVSSPEGDNVPNYHSTVTYSAEELRQLVTASYGEAVLGDDPATWIANVTPNASGRVSSLTVGGVTLSGGAARTLFGLRSTCFTVSYDQEVFTFSVTGYGHGVGMSQYGANTMAQEGTSWQDILLHYYTGVAITPMA